MSVTRIDAALVTRGLARSRTQAQALLRDGLVRLDGAVVTKASTPVEDAAHLVVETAPAGAATEWIARGWVGRGAVKLDHALTLWADAGLSVAGRRCLDIGASTGGFTQVLLERGAAHVIALDVGHDQLDRRVADDARVTELSGTHVREATVELLGGRVGAVVCDVSFISLRHVLPLVPALCEDEAEIVVLVKPQFEVGRAAIGADGVVRSTEQRRQVLQGVTSLAREHGLGVQGLDRSPVTGETGNHEYLLWLRPAGPGMIGWGLTPEQLEQLCHQLSQEEDR